MTALDRKLARRMLPLEQSAADALLRAIVHRVDSSGARIRVQIEALADDPRSGIELVMPYGFLGIPRDPTGDPSEHGEAIRAHIGGSPDHPLALMVNDLRGRPADRVNGDVWLYDHRGQFIRLREGKVVVEGDEIELGEGATEGVAREGDTTEASAATDSAWWGIGTGWFDLVGAATNVGPPPPTLEAEIYTASTTVKAVD